MEFVAHPVYAYTAEKFHSFGLFIGCRLVGGRFPRFLISWNKHFTRYAHRFQARNNEVISVRRGRRERGCTEWGWKKRRRRKVEKEERRKVAAAFLLFLPRTSASFFLSFSPPPPPPPLPPVSIITEHVHESPPPSRHGFLFHSQSDFLANCVELICTLG